MPTNQAGAERKSQDRQESRHLLCNHLSSRSFPGGQAGARAAAQGVCLAQSRNGKEGTHNGSSA